MQGGKSIQPTTGPAAVSRGSLWTGRVISTLIVLFLTWDGVMKVMKVPQVIEASAKVGFDANTIFGIGAVLLVCTALYVIPKTSVLGAILLTGYLGGATVTNVRLGGPAFNIAFPVVFGVLVWLGLFLRDKRLRALIPLRTP